MNTLKGLTFISNLGNFERDFLLLYIAAKKSRKEKVVRE